MTDDPDEAPDPSVFTDASPCPANDMDLAMLGDLLMDRSVSCVMIPYSGSGDSGSVEEVIYEPADTVLSKAAEDKLVELAEGYIPEGYENNEGGSGTLTLYPNEGLAELEQVAYSEDSEPMPVPAASLPEELHERLTQAGITRIVAHFDGCGDSGQFDDVSVTPGDAVLSDDLWDAVEEFLLNQLPGGWEINEGSYGTFTVQVRRRRVSANAHGRLERRDVQITRWRWRS